MSRDWNRAYEEGDTPWDKGYAAPPLAEFISQHSIQGKVLVPGCGAGHDVRLLAGQGAAVTGIDIAQSALNKARACPEAGGERYVWGDFLNPGDEHHGAYDWVVEHTCLCAIEPSEREAYVHALRALLRPEGQFLAVFFREVSDYDGQGPPHPISATEIEGLFAADFETVESYVPTQTYPSRPVGCEEVRWMRMRA